jgi:tetratricopeptide (TPR) repeat protein
MRKSIWLIVILAGVAAYHNSFHGPFIFDDLISIADNPHIRRLWPIWERLMNAPHPSTVEGRPIVSLTLALNFAAGGRSVWGYHAVNVALHLMCALLLFGIVRRTLDGARLRERYGRQAEWLALAVALIWVVHPLQTESVTYIIQRTELLMGLFLLLTLYCVLRGDGSVRPRAWYAAAVLACALGMGSKEVMAVAPLLVFLYDWIFLSGSFRRAWQQRGSLYMVLAGTWMILVALVAASPRQAAGFRFASLSPLAYLLTEAGVIVHYLRLCFWPDPLVIDYLDWPIVRSLSDAVSSVFLVLALLGGSIWALLRRRPLGFVGGWFFLILAPTSSFLPILGEVAAERRMYMPLAAVVVVSVLAAHWVLTELFSGDRRNDRLRGWIGALLLSGVVFVLGALTVRRNEDYRSELSIWADAAAKRPNNWRAHSNFGKLLVEEGKLDEAIENFRDAARLEPNSAYTHYNLGAAQLKKGEMDEATVSFREAVRLNPSFARAHYTWGLALERQGKLEEASQHYETAVHLDPNLDEARSALDNVRARQGK